MKEHKSELISKRLEKTKGLKDANIILFPNQFQVTHTVEEIMDCTALF